MDPMSGCDTPTLVFTLEPKDSTLQYKKFVHHGNNFPYITSLILIISDLNLAQGMLQYSVHCTVYTV